MYLMTITFRDGTRTDVKMGDPTANTAPAGEILSIDSPDFGASAMPISQGIMLKQAVAGDEGLKKRLIDVIVQSGGTKHTPGNLIQDTPRIIYSKLRDIIACLTDEQLTTLYPLLHADGSSLPEAAAAEGLTPAQSAWNMLLTDLGLIAGSDNLPQWGVECGEYSALLRDFKAFRTNKFWNSTINKDAVNAAKNLTGYLAGIELTYKDGMTSTSKAMEALTPPLFNALSQLVVDVIMGDHTFSTAGGDPLAVLLSYLLNSRMTGLLSRAAELYKKEEIPRSQRADLVRALLRGGKKPFIDSGVAINESRISLRSMIKESLLLEELTKTDKKTIERMVRKQIKRDMARQKEEHDKEMKKLRDDLAKIVAKEVTVVLKDKVTREDIADITKDILKKLYRELSFWSPNVIDKLKLTGGPIFF